MSTVSRTQLSECLWAATATEAGRVRVALHGEIDISNTDALAQLILTTAGERIVLDLAEVSFMGAAGAGTLVHLRSELAGRGVQLCIVGASPALRRLLHLLELDDLCE